MKSHRIVVGPMLLGELPFRVLTQAFWRPQALKPSNFVATAGGRKVDILGLRWRAEESWVNHSLDGILSALPLGALAELMRANIPNFIEQALSPAFCHGYALNPYIGEPDLFLMGSNQVVAGEIKIGAKKSNGRYSFQQFTKYLTLSLLLRASRRIDLPRQMFHLLVVPTLNPKEFCEDFNDWAPEIRNGWLHVDLTRVTFKDRRGRFSDLESWRTTVLEPLKKHSYAAANEIDPDVVAEIEADLSPMTMEVRVVTWDDLMAQTSELANSVGLGHLDSSCRLVANLGHGRAGRADRT